MARKKYEDPAGEKCPSCQGKLKHMEGCAECIDCGWSSCEEA